MCDRNLTPAEQTRRGKDSRPKQRRFERARAVRDERGDIVAVVRGTHVTDEDLAQAAALVRWMPDYTAAIRGAGRG